MALVNIPNATFANINHFRYLHQSYDNALLMKPHRGTVIKRKQRVVLFISIGWPSEQHNGHLLIAIEDIIITTEGTAVIRLIDISWRHVSILNAVLLSI